MVGSHIPFVLMGPECFCCVQGQNAERCRTMNYVFWLIGVIVVIAAVLSFLGLR